MTNPELDKDLKDYFARFIETNNLRMADEVHRQDEFAEAIKNLDQGLAKMANDWREVAKLMRLIQLLIRGEVPVPEPFLKAFEDDTSE